MAARLAGSRTGGWLLILRNRPGRADFRADILDAAVLAPLSR
jgi:hypothetical protein